jgi:hypothetical protein
MKNRRALRRRFLRGLIEELRVTAPVMSGLVILMLVLGGIVGLLEHWSLLDSIYFTFVTGLTIGYGDLVPKTLLGRLLAPTLGLTGILLTALLAAVAVRALPDFDDGDGDGRR